MNQIDIYKRTQNYVGITFLREDPETKSTYYIYRIGATPEEVCDKIKSAMNEKGFMWESYTCNLM